MAVAARQLARGGSVAWLSLNCSQFNVPKFCTMLESSLLAVYQVRYSELLEAFATTEGPQGQGVSTSGPSSPPHMSTDGVGSPSSGNGLSCWIAKTLAQRFALSQCFGLEELAATLGEMAATGPHEGAVNSVWENWLRDSAAATATGTALPNGLQIPANSNNHNAGGGGPASPVPLLVVDGLGATSGVYTLGRHLGQGARATSSNNTTGVPTQAAGRTGGRKSATSGIGSGEVEKMCGGPATQLSPSLGMIGEKIDAVLYRSHCACVVGVTTWGGAGGTAGGNQLAPFASSLPSKSLIATGLLSSNLLAQPTTSSGSGEGSSISWHLQLQPVAAGGVGTTPTQPRALNFVVGECGPQVV